jgi:hypothetical protein
MYILFYKYLDKPGQNTFYVWPQKTPVLRSSSATEGGQNYTETKAVLSVSFCANLWLKQFITGCFDHSVLDASLQSVSHLCGFGFPPAQRT